MNTDRQTQTSKLLSLVLRHKPETIGLMLDEQGWTRVTELLEKLGQHQHPLTREELDELVASNSKKRFAFSEDGNYIRASQGHSREVDLALAAQSAPEVLYHGTVAGILPQIRKEGLKKMSRQYVHLSADEQTAIQVGSRRGKPVILQVQSGRMHRDGIPFYRSANGVWLVDAVTPEYIEFKH